MTKCTEFDTLDVAKVLQVVWHPRAKEVLSDFPVEVKSKFGYLIYRLQVGEVLTMPHVKPMPSVGRGIKELRVRGKDGVYRSFYLEANMEGILIFYAFKKKSQKTSKKDIGMGTKNLKEMRQWLKIK